MSDADIFILHNELMLKKLTLRKKILDNNPKISFEELNKKITRAMRSFNARKLKEFDDRLSAAHRLDDSPRFY